MGIPGMTPEILIAGKHLYSTEKIFLPAGVHSLGFTCPRVFHVSDPGYRKKPTSFGVVGFFVDNND